MKKTFKDSKYTYEVVLPQMIHNKTKVTSKDILANKSLRDELLEMAWQGKLGRRDEEDFNNNGIFKIVFGDKKDDDPADPNENPDSEDPSENSDPADPNENPDTEQSQKPSEPIKVNDAKVPKSGKDKAPK